MNFFQVLIYHIGLDLPYLFLEHIPYLKHHFKHPIQMENGFYQVPKAPGASTELTENALALAI